MPSQTIQPLCWDMVNFRVPRLASIIYIMMCCVPHVLALNTCVTYMCMESSGGVVAVFLTDERNPACPSAAANYMVSKCGVGYNPITCNVDCSSIYAWNGAYWNAQGCNIVGAFPCGVEGDCNSPVLSVCQNTQSSPSPTQSTPPPMSTVPASTASPSSPTASSDTNMLTKCCVGQESCTFQVADQVDILISYRKCRWSDAERLLQGSLSNLIYSIAVGSPVTNCQPGANSDITNTVGGSMTFEETWTVDTSVGLDLGKLQIGLNSQWTHSKSISMDQNIEIVVQPGYKVGSIVFCLTVRRHIRWYYRVSWSQTYNTTEPVGVCKLAMGKSKYRW